jgi:hypothetical protein
MLTKAKKCTSMGKYQDEGGIPIELLKVNKD